MGRWRSPAGTAPVGGRRPDQTLRAVLGLLLAGLVAVSVAVSLGTSSSERVVESPLGGSAATTGGPGAAAKGASGEGPVATPGPTPPASSAGPGAAPAGGPGAAPKGGSPTGGTAVAERVSAGCGLSLAPGAPTVAVGHCAVLEVGDSLGNDLGWGLAREVSATSGLDLVQADVSSTGLANRGFYDWPAHLATDLRRYHPQLVVISLGGNDEQGMIVDGGAVQFATPAWEKAYRARVASMLAEATGAGAYVLWVGMPVMAQPGFSAGIRLLDSIYRQVVSRYPGAVFLPTWGLFAGPGGRFEAEADVDGWPSQLRQADGVHYSFVGENVLATYVVRHLSTIFHVRLAPVDPEVITGWVPAG